MTEEYISIRMENEIITMDNFKFMIEFNLLSHGKIFKMLKEQYDESKEDEYMKLLREIKTYAIQKQQYELAANCRDLERFIIGLN